MKHLRAPVLLATAAGLMAGPVSAQLLEEIVVTARKVEESLQNVPLSITAFTASTIEAAGIRDLYDIAELTPGLSFFNAQGEFLPVPVIRGIAPTDINGENNTAIFVDGVYISGRRGLNFSQLDLERIEVVKGPQSALYGRNAMAGAVNFVTRRPTDEFEARTEVTVGTDERRAASGIVSGPLMGDMLMGRIALLYDGFGGTYDNALAPETDIGGYRYRSLQGGLLFRPTDTLDIYGTVYYSNDGIDDSPTTGIIANCEPSIATPPGEVRLLNVCGRIPGISGAAIPKIGEASGEDRKLIRASLAIDWDLAYGSLSLLTGYSDTKQSARVDGNRSLGDRLPFVYCNTPSPVTGFCSSAGALQVVEAGILQVITDDKVREISQEVRFTSPQDRPLRYTTGLYYYDVSEKGGPGFGGLIASADLPSDFIGFGPFVAPFPGALIPIGNSIYLPWFEEGGSLDPLQRNTKDNDTRAWAVFSGVDFDLTNQLTARAELRYSREKKTVRGLEWDLVDLEAPDPLQQASGRRTFDQWTGRLGLDYRVSEQWMVYVSVARGAKPGGFSELITTGIDSGTGDTIDIATQIPFDEETLVAYEVGAKGTLADGRLALSMSMFMNDWDDIALRQNILTDPESGFQLETPVAITANIADARVWGWEFEADMLLTEQLSARLTGSYTDAQLRTARDVGFQIWPSFAPDGNLAGNQLLRQPKWNGSASLSYQVPLTAGWDFVSRADVTFQDRVYVGNDNQSYLPSHTYVNLRAGVENSRYSVDIWVRNLLNDDGPVAAYRDVFFTNTADVNQELPPATSFSDLFPVRYTVTHPRLRTVGITGKVRFGAAVR